MINSSSARPRTRVWLAVTAGFALAAAGVAALPALAGNAATGPVVSVAGSPPALTTGRGATVPFVEQEAENAATNGTVLAKSFLANTLAGEASGRRVVQLAAGQYVDFTLSAPADAISVRASVPDGASGTLAVTGGGVSTTLPVTSKYGWYYGSYPFTNTPGSNPHHFYDESRVSFGATLPAGTVVRVAAGTGTSVYTVDLADFYQVGAPLAQPAGSLSVTSYGADPTGAADSGPAFDQAIAAGSSQGKVVWVPQGTFTINRHIVVNNVTLTGAGTWYSILHGDGVGVYGNYAPSPSTNVTLSHFAIIGEVQDRNDSAQVNAIGGALTNSTVDDIWMQHTKVGAWLDGPFTGLTIKNSHIVDTTADGVNFHNGVTNSTVTNTFVRNTGDDGLAMWAEQNQESGNSFTHNTVTLPILANDIAIYGGQDITVSDNVVADTQTQGGGLHFANRFSAVPVAGTFTVARNTTLRAGNLDPNWLFGVGAIWFDARDGQMTNTINVSDLNAYDSPYEAIMFIDSQVTGVHFSNVAITGTGTFALQLQGTGAASFQNVTATAVGASAGTYNCQGTSAFAVTDSGGNSGWNTTFCGQWPNPVYGYDSTGSGSATPTPTPTTTSPSPTTSSPSPTTTPTTASPSPTTTPTGNLALGRPVTVSSVGDVYGGTNLTDGNASTYWESAAGAFPATATVDLGSATAIGRAVLKLPPATAWTTRTETLSILTSTDNTTWTTAKTSTGYTFDPATGNTTTITLPTTTARYLRVSITANTGWNAGQLSELELYQS
jgi:Alpha-1,3-glucanase catalytic domain D1/NedA-like, galactose-binding domain/Alpha-1,3-glucanase catalytic domain D2